jgi:tetratricopeptide (TPR) repeat protein
MRRSLAVGLLVIAALATNAFAMGEARLTGKITDATTHSPIKGATITVTTNVGKNFKQVFKAKDDGSYAIFVLDGTVPYDFLYEAPDYASYTERMKLKLSEPNVRDIMLAPPAAPAAPAAAAAAKADPATAAYNEGAQLANEGKDAEAIAKMEEAVAAKADFMPGITALAQLYYRTKNYPKAIEEANKVIALTPDDPDMNSILADSYSRTGNKEKAFEFAKKAPANPRMLFNEAAKAINAGKDGDAEPLLRQAIAADPKFAIAYYELGMVYVRSGKNADAKTNLQKYLELDPKGKDAATAKEMLKYVQ